MVNSHSNSRNQRCNTYSDQNCESLYATATIIYNLDHRSFCSDIKNLDVAAQVSYMDRFLKP